jgi:hypothetical protein
VAVGGLGLPLPLPSTGGPQLPFNFAANPTSNYIDLVAGAAILVPAGQWMCYLGQYSWLQFLDPISGQWLYLASGTRTNWVTISSDGANYRIWNPKGFPVSATVTGAGSAYTQAGTTVTASARGSLWHAIIGGAVGAFTVGNDAKGNAGGTNFTLPPIIVLSCPPTSLTGLPTTATAMGGIQATATAALSGNAITSVTVDIAGAGYLSAPTVQVIPNPFDVNIGTITVPTITCVLTGSGTVTAVVMDSPGPASGAAPTLTIAGGTGPATATANIVATAATDTIVLQQVPSWT